jgi:hypothetical protein
VSSRKDVIRFVDKSEPSALATQYCCDNIINVFRFQNRDFMAAIAARRILEKYDIVLNHNDFIDAASELNIVRSNINAHGPANYYVSVDMVCELALTAKKQDAIELFQSLKSKVSNALSAEEIAEKAKELENANKHLEGALEQEEKNSGQLKIERDCVRHHNQMLIIENNNQLKKIQEQQNLLKALETEKEVNLSNNESFFSIGERKTKLQIMKLEAALMKAERDLETLRAKENIYKERIQLLEKQVSFLSKQ